MPTLAVIGDVHAHFAYLDRVLARVEDEGVDGILFVGDLGSHHVAWASRRTPENDALYLDSVQDVLDRARALAPVLYVPGNHDLPSLDFAGNVDDGVEDVAGLRVAGIGGAGPAKFGFCYEWDEDDIRGRQLAEADVLLCHCPPAGTSLGMTRGGHDAGSQAIRERAEAHTGFLVCGHIHEAPGTARINQCLCLNVGGLGRPFGRAQVGFVRRHNGVDTVGHCDLETGTTRWWPQEIG